MDHVADADAVGDGAGVEYLEGAVVIDADGPPFDGSAGGLHSHGPSDGVEVIAIGGLGGVVVAEQVELGQDRLEERRRGDRIADARGALGGPADVDSAADDHGAVGACLREHPCGFSGLAIVADDEQVALWFASCDTNGDGWMVFREATRALDFDRPRFQSFDADRDGRIDSSEFTDYYRYRLTESGGFRPPQVKVAPTLATPRKAEQLRLAFDTNADRAISEEELAAVLEGYGRYDLEVGKLMDEADRDKDLLLSEDELEGIAALLVGAAGPAVSSLPAGAVSGIDQLFGAPAGPEVHEPGALPRIAGPVTPYRRLDLDGDGVVSLEDLEALQRPLRSPVRIAPILLALDADGDGNIDRAELRAALGDVR